jgi:hypothetical protein
MRYAGSGIDTEAWMEPDSVDRGGRGAKHAWQQRRGDAEGVTPRTTPTPSWHTP